MDPSDYLGRSRYISYTAVYSAELAIKYNIIA